MAGASGRLRPQIVLFGDSITQFAFEGPDGWGSHIAHLYQRQADVVLRGYSGYTSTWALPLLKHVFPPSAEPALVTIFFGANDASLPDRGSAKQHIPLAQYRRDMAAIVRHVQGLASSPRVLLIAPPPIDEDARVAHCQAKYGTSDTQPERTNEAAGRYAEACIQLAAELQVPVVNTWGQLQKEADWKALLNDGLHFSPAGQRKLGALVEAAIRTHFPQFVPEALPSDLPLWSDIDPAAPADSFAAALDVLTKGQKS